MGKRVYNTDTNTYRQVVSKKLPVNIYNNVEKIDDEKDEYTVTWRAYTGDNQLDDFWIYETQGDKFLKADGSYIDMTNYVKPTGIYFSSIENALSSDYGGIEIWEHDSSIKGKSKSLHKSN